MTTIDLPPTSPPVGSRRGGTHLLTRAKAVTLGHTSTANPRWYSPARATLLLTTLVAYVWSLGASGWANAYYSAAVQAGASSWKAWFFGSFDAANAITVDKPPASLWVMGLSARIFGVSSWSILVPEALMGVATVALVIAAVRRWFHPSAALLAGAVMATIPVATLMFRFNNPDALLVLLLTAAAYMMTRAIESARTKWLVFAGMLVGFGFLTKMMQAFVVLPAFGLAYLLAGPTRLRTRIAQGVAMAAATFASAAWWVAIVELWPKSSRPYIGGSQKNSVIELIFGYNGFGRLTGNETGSVGGGATQGGNWGPTGWLRMFNSQFGTQISWLLPAALISMVVGLAVTARRDRTDRTRAAVLLWGLWLVITGVTFSLGKGIIHEYYSVALAPAIAALVGIGASLAIDHRDRWYARLAMSLTLVVSAIWAVALLLRTSSWNPWLRPVISVAGGVAAVAYLFFGKRRRIAQATAALGLVALLAAPTAFSVATIKSPHTGSLPTAGPSSGRGGMGGPGGMGRPGGFGGGMPPAGFGGPGNTSTGSTSTVTATATVTASSVTSSATNSTRPNNTATNSTGLNNTATNSTATNSTATNSTATSNRPTTGGMGGLLNASTASKELVAALKANSSAYRWAAATVGANSAAGYQLASDEPVLAIGGFNGSDPAPSLAEFQAFVAKGQIHYFIGSGSGGGFGGQMGGSSSSSEIASWVSSNFTATTIGGTTVYDLTASANAAG